jgi:hypothetical protein
VGGRWVGGGWAVGACGSEREAGVRAVVVPRRGGAKGAGRLLGGAVWWRGLLQDGGRCGCAPPTRVRSAPRAHALHAQPLGREVERGRRVRGERAARAL